MSEFPGFIRITVRGSIVGTRLNLQESLDFAAQRKVEAAVATDRLENINDVLRTCTRVASKVAWC